MKLIPRFAGQVVKIRACRALCHAVAPIIRSEGW